MVSGLRISSISLLLLLLPSSLSLPPPFAIRSSSFVERRYRSIYPPEKALRTSFNSIPRLPNLVHLLFQRAQRKEHGRSLRGRRLIVEFTKTTPGQNGRRGRYVGGGGEDRVSTRC